MAYSESLAKRVRFAAARIASLTEKRMFSGLGFFLRGNMVVGVWNTSLIARLGPEQAAAAQREPHVRPFAPTGRPMKGWAMIEADGLETDEQLATWIQRSIDFVSTLPEKAEDARKGAKKTQRKKRK